MLYIGRLSSLDFCRSIRISTSLVHHPVNNRRTPGFSRSTHPGGILAESQRSFPMPSLRNIRYSTLYALIVTVLAAPVLLAAQQPYKVLDHWKLGGEGGWDYLLVDSAAHRLYVTHG